jgi:hypothetical protein
MGKVAVFVEQSSGKLARKFINIETNTKLGTKDQDVNFFRRCNREET